MAHSPTASPPCLLEAESPTLASEHELGKWGSAPLGSGSGSDDAFVVETRVALMSLSAATLPSAAQQGPRNKVGPESRPQGGESVGSVDAVRVAPTDQARCCSNESEGAAAPRTLSFGKCASERGARTQGRAAHHHVRNASESMMEASCAAVGGIQEELAVEQLQARLAEEEDARRAAEDEAMMLQQQLLSWQQAASTAQSSLQSAQWCRDSLVRENLALQQSLLEAEEERRSVEAQLHQALATLDEVKPGAKDEAMESMRREAVADPDNASACVQRYLALQEATGQKVAALTQDNNELASRLVEVTLELAQLKEDKARQQHHTHMVEEVNMSLIRRVERLSEMVAELKCGNSNVKATSSFVFGRAA